MTRRINWRVQEEGRREKEDHKAQTLSNLANVELSDAVGKVKS